MPILEWKEKDFGTPYKTFAELSEGDAVWVVDLRDISVSEFRLEKVAVSDESYSTSHNLRCVEYVFVSDGRRLCKAYDGNTFIDDVSMFNDGLVIFTDKRIADSMAMALNKRCSIQWEIFKDMFGSALGAVMPRDIRLR